MLCDTLRTIIFTKEGKHKKMKTSVLLKRFIPYYGKYKGIMVMDLFCAALTTVCELVLPLIPVILRILECGIWRPLL